MESNKARTYLDTSQGMGEYAKNFGAVHDKIQHAWYVVGEVPSELFNLTNKVTREKTAPIVPPSCPKCGFHMNLIEGKNGSFYGCSQFFKFGCQGSIDYEVYLEKLGKTLPKTVAEILDSNITPSISTSPSVNENVRNLDQELQLANDEIVKLCKNKFKEVIEAKRWLTTPKLALNWNTPIKSMTSVDGCHKVILLIQAL